MATVHKVTPKNGAKTFRDGCKAHWQVRPNPAEAAHGVGKATRCRQGPAEALAGQIRDQLHRGVFVAADRTTVGEWAESWLTAKRLKGVRAGTLRNYGKALRLRIIPTLGAYPMTQLRPEHVRAAAAEWTDAPSAANFAAAVLRDMYARWTADGRSLPRGNPVTVAEVAPKPARQPRHPLTDVQVQAWREALLADMRPMFDIESYAGARMSEVLGLQEQDITWIGKLAAPLAPQLVELAALPPDRYAARRVCVRFARQLDDPRYHGGASVAVDTKNKRAKRSLPLPQTLVRTLAEGLTAYPPLPGGWLFGNRRGPGRAVALDPRPWHPKAYNRCLRTAATKVGIPLPPGQCSHALRHYRVSVLRDEGVADQRIAEWIGDSVQTITQTYGQPMPDSLEQISEVINARESAPRLRVVHGG